MVKLESRNTNLQQQLDPIMESQQVIDFNNRIKKRLEKINRDIQKKKLKKFHRDLGDFKSDSIFVWQQTLNPIKTNDSRSAQMLTYTVRPQIPQTPVINHKNIHYNQENGRSPCPMYDPRPNRGGRNQRGQQEVEGTL